VLFRFSFTVGQYRLCSRFPYAVLRLLFPYRSGAEMLVDSRTISLWGIGKRVECETPLQISRERRDLLYWLIEDYTAALCWLHRAERL